MKASDLVVGKTYICDEYLNRPIIYVGVEQDGIFAGDSHFVAAIDTDDYEGAICDTEQLEKYRLIDGEQS